MLPSTGRCPVVTVWNLLLTAQYFTFPAEGKDVTACIPSLYANAQYRNKEAIFANGTRFLPQVFFFYLLTKEKYKNQLEISHTPK